MPDATALSQLAVNLARSSVSLLIGAFDPLRCREYDTISQQLRRLTGRPPLLKTAAIHRHSATPLRKLRHESPQFIEVAARPASRQPSRAPQGPRLRDQQDAEALQGAPRLSPK